MESQSSYADLEGSVAPSFYYLSKVLFTTFHIAQPAPTMQFLLILELARHAPVLGLPIP